MREFIQFDATAEKITPEVLRLLTDKQAARAQARRQTEVLEIMGRGGPNPSELAADAVLKVLKNRKA